ncbi:hypothetical protein CDV50_02045 [Haematobacter massiliensis]|uniref:Uncharacterized protein n=1 Tax=Haematobacter massiliensis TaxID=195105 RepID=A0A086YBA2_9RHOB|nr:hypothetical protein [Haematobacter massiliensis]KFI31552.1 hypothetical protein CN97_10015 [Haematobacter massiliensis]OWJ73660.1 hypothetical protein CDV50_02045 [Haematobacter massiliensis]OWJ81871.1 hypothetical protein CDV51_18760 [Haematobacter massiliensis]QBJ23421.1 hypothetical protein HmaOT1_03575 [Haematobacter massiliensis]
MKDFLKRDIGIGDTVVHGVGGRYGGLSGPYDVVGLTPKMVRIGKRGSETSSVVLPNNLVVVAFEGVE